MKYILFLLTILAIIISCNTGNKKNNLLSKPGDVKADEYVINIDRDTTIETKNGALLKIPKGSLKIDKGNKVTLEIKEAYSISQMIRTGLTTQSNGDPLSSGGMIYIDAKAGQNVTITQAIKVAIPSDYLSNNMQLFKGEKDADENINWKDAAALPENKQLSSVDQGQVLFQSKCASCHMIGKDATGPNLAQIVKRFGTIGEGNYRYYEHGFYPYLKDSMLKRDATRKGDVPDFRIYDHYDPFYPYKCNLVRMYGSVGPIMFNDTSSYDYADDIYRYIQNESDRNNLSLPLHVWLKDCADSCENYRQTVAALNERRQVAGSTRDKLVEDNGSMVEDNNIATRIREVDDSMRATEITPIDFDAKVSPRNYDAEYYQFTIETFGWYNIDILLKEVNGAEESELFVRIVGQYRQKIQVYLIIPSAKVYGEGGPAERNPDEFAFFYKNGKLALPQNAEAYILAVTETEESIAFALKKFNTTTKQELEISLNQSTKEEFTAAINNLSADKMHIKVTDSKNAGEIRRIDTMTKNIDQELKKTESLRPKGCDCDCGLPKTVAPTSQSEYVPN